MASPADRLGQVVVELTEMRGFLLSPGRGIEAAPKRWLLDHIDAALAEAGVLDIVRDIHHASMEDVRDG